MFNADEQYLIFTGGAASGRNGGYNGGTAGGSYSTSTGTWTYGGGGGATDIRYFQDEIEYSNTSNNGILARIMVAGGGGGAAWYSDGHPGGTFTKTGTTLFTTSGYTNSSGTGGGYIAGARNTTDYAGYGGNSYISGYYNNVPNQDGIIEKYHVSGKYFYNILYTEGEHRGNGYAKITFIDDASSYKSQDIYEYKNDGNYDLFEVEVSGLYKVELWGASGANYSYSGSSGTVRKNGGKGGYTSGTINMIKGEKYVLFVGGAGSGRSAGYNGAGTGGQYETSDTWKYGGGGGSTDIRYFGTEEVINTPNDFNGILARIMVAGGGGGAAWYNPGINGGLINSSTSTKLYNGVTSTKGGGGGSGYYGGNAGNTDQPGSGGTSFISGYDGCNAIDKLSTASNIILLGNPNHFSGKIFNNGVLLSGSENIPTFDGTSTMLGNTGNGYAKITYLGTN